jgi:hypothetical protein
VTFIVGVGTGPVRGGTLLNGSANMQQLVKDLGVDRVAFRPRKSPACGDGRFDFIVERAGVKVEVSMPGLPLASVRVIDPEKENVLEFPRLYVEGNSYYWCWAVDVLRQALTEG